jgi:hypothetical protein
MESAVRVDQGCEQHSWHWILLRFQAADSTPQERTAFRWLQETFEE